MDHNHLSKYNNELDGWIVAAVQSGVTDFWQLVSVLPGVYPTVVKEAVERLIEQSRIPKIVGVEQPTRVADHELDSEVPGLPTPHPLSSDWRFTKKTAYDLLNRVAHTGGRKGAVALLGAPSVFFLADQDDVPGQFILLDDNHSLADKVPRSANGRMFRCCDVKRDVADIPPVHTVVADPPWYQEDVLGFLRTAARVSSHEGTVFLGFASEGTRPGIVAERDLIIDEADKMELKFVGLEPLMLSYATPFFEYNALRAARFRYIPATWRRGDLLQFRKVGDVQPLEESLNVTQCPWMEAHVGGIEIRIRRDSQVGFTDPLLVPLVSGDILPSVSRRDSLGKQADVWTIGNRVYRCEGRGVLLSILRALDEGKGPIEVIKANLGRSLNCGESEVVERVITQLEGIVETEQKEMWKFYNGRT